MAATCPRCRSYLENPKRLACPHCGYSLRLPAVGMVGTALLVLALVAYLAGLFAPEGFFTLTLLGGVALTAAGMAALFAASWMIRRDRRAI